MFELILDVKNNTIFKNSYTRNRKSRTTIEHSFEEEWLKNTSLDFNKVVDYYPEIKQLLNPENYNLLNIYLKYQLNEAFLISHLNIVSHLNIWIEIDHDASVWQIESYTRDIMHCLTENKVYFNSILITKT